MVCELNGPLKQEHPQSKIGGLLPNEKDNRGTCHTFLGVKKAVFVSLRVFSFKRSITEAFVVPFRVLSRKKCDRRCVVLIRIGTSLGVKKYSHHAHKTGSRYLLGILFKSYDKDSWVQGNESSSSYIFFSNVCNFNKICLAGSIEGA